jgi:hypothetical protein
VKIQYHRLITARALSSHFDKNALETVISANLGQDIWFYQIGHDHFHYDNNSFVAGDAYIENLRCAAVDALSRGDAVAARQFFGRLTHTVQDFYAHSNYIALWRESYPGMAPEEINPALVELLISSRLRSGRIYHPFEWFWFIRSFKPWVEPLLPRDSHAWMNIDEPSRPGFDYAYAAAVKRTELEFERLCQALNPEQIHLFTEIQNRKS